MMVRTRCLFLCLALLGTGCASHHDTAPTAEQRANGEVLTISLFHGGQASVENWGVSSDDLVELVKATSPAAVEIVPQGASKDEINALKSKLQGAGAKNVSVRGATR